VTLVERCMLLSAVALTTLACVEWVTNVPGRIGSVHPVIGLVPDVGVPPSESIDSAAKVAAATDPFRLDRRPSSVPYRPDLEGIAPPAKPPKPALGLGGLVGNAALVDGVPGRGTTAIVHTGDTLGGLRIRRIGRDTVIVTGADTTWRLTLRRAWQ
jgi:hypothetical protein